jgi:putative membrane protein
MTRRHLPLNPYTDITPATGSDSALQRRSMDMRAIRVFAGAAFVLGLAALVVACDGRDEGGGRSSGMKPRPPVTDSSWLAQAAEANLAEIDAGRLAESRTASSDVRPFAQQMVEDHSKSNQEVTDLAKKKGIPFPTRPDEKHRKAVADLAELSGAEFDRKYADMMVSDHEKAVSLFESKGNSTDSDVKAFVDRTLPTLRHHLQMARDLKIKVSGAPKAD